MKQWIQAMLFAIIAMIFISACTVAEPKSSAEYSPPQEAEQPLEPPQEIPAAPPEEVQPPEPVEREVVLMAVGDIMVHQEQLDAAWDDETQSYQFAPFFAKVSHLFQEADWVIGNLETTLAGSDQRYSGYPMFNTPESLAATLKQIGFTAVTTANNHSLDRREIGVLRTLQHLDEHGLLHTGTFRSAEEREVPLLLEKDGIKLGVVAYTYGTNGIPLPADKPYLVNLLDEELIAQDIATARQMGADVVAVALHFGDEYKRQPNSTQRQWVDTAFSLGADLILGHHPHVLQPYEWREIETPDGQKRRGLVIYSLGNFISAQRGDYKDVGGILKVTLHKQDDQPATIKAAEFIPTYVHFYRTSGKRNYVIYPLQEVLETTTDTRDPTITAEIYQKMAKLYKEIQSHLSLPTDPQ